MKQVMIRAEAPLVVLELQNGRDKVRYKTCSYTYCFVCSKIIENKRVRIDTSKPLTLNEKSL